MTSDIQAEMQEMIAIIEARDRRLIYRRGTVPRCGRPTRAGTPCKAPRMSESPFPFLRAVAIEYGDYLPSACRRHATPAERADHDRICAFTASVIAEYESAIRRVERVHCWAWEVTDEHRSRAGAVGRCADPELAHRMAMRLLRDWQAGRCGLCAGRTEVLDHDHDTGWVRGWLCRGCNTSDGVSDHHPEGPFMRYQKRNPASILRLQIRYFSPFTGWAKPGLTDTANPDRSPGYALAGYLADSGAE